MVDLRSPGWGEAQPWVLNINMRPALISERQRVASACRTKRISARPAADKAGGTKQAHNPVQLMPPRFEHEHEHDLVADLGVSAVERSAALRLCGESVPSVTSAIGLPETRIASRLLNASFAPSFYDPKDI